MIQLLVLISILYYNSAAAMRLNTNLRNKVTSMIIGSISLNPLNVNAQIPMAEDFYQTSGTYVGKRTGNNGQSSESIDLSIPSNSVQRTIDLVKKFKIQVPKREFDDIMIETKELKNSIRSKYFGYKSSNNLEKYLEMKDVSNIEDEREELSVNLEQLEDFSRSNRIVFFNTEDLKGIQEMAQSEKPNETIEVNIEEAMGFVNAIETLSNKLADELK